MKSCYASSVQCLSRFKLQQRSQSRCRTSTASKYIDSLSIIMSQSSSRPVSARQHISINLLCPPSVIYMFSCPRFKDRPVNLTLPVCALMSNRVSGNSVVLVVILHPPYRIWATIALTCYSAGRPPIRISSPHLQLFPRWVPRVWATSSTGEPAFPNILSIKPQVPTL